MRMKALLSLAWRSCITVGAATFLAQGQQPDSFPLAAPAGQNSNAKTTPPPGAQNQGALDPNNWKYGPGVQRAARRQDLESGEGENDGGQKVTGGTVLQRDGSRNVLRNGERRL
jgi:hypothetical protein